MSSLSSLAVAIFATIASLLAGDTAGRDLRPTEHGLVFQASPPANSSPEMKSFFSTNSGSSSSSNADAPLRNTTESLPPLWWGVTGGDRRSHVGRVLVIVSLVCGITGGTLLVASALLYLFKHRKKHHQNETFRGCNNNTNNNSNSNSNNNNKLELVAVMRNS